MKYICYKRFKGISITGETVNIPAMTEGDDFNSNIIYINDKQICVNTSLNGQGHFCSNEDGKGEYRGQLILALLKYLAQPDWHNELDKVGNKKPEQLNDSDISTLNKIMDSRNKDYDAKWLKIWNDEKLKKFKRPEHADMWLWNRDFFDASIEDLEYIANLVDMKLKI